MIELVLHSAWTAGLHLCPSHGLLPHTGLFLGLFPDSPTSLQIHHAPLESFTFLIAPLLSKIIVFLTYFYALLVYFPSSRIPQTGYLLKEKDYVYFSLRT